MSTAFLYNAFGKYETNDHGEPGITLRYAGIDFWLPYQKVTPVPNFTFNELDHDKSTGPNGITGAVYKSEIVNGRRVAEELCEKQVPVSYREMGIRVIEGKATGKAVVACAGADTNGEALTVEVPEREPTRAEQTACEAAAKAYKERVVADYFTSKRERMHGGHGQTHPDPTIRGYMSEMGVEDLDDVTAHAKNSGLNPELLRQILEEVVKSTSDVNAEAIVAAVKAVRSNQHAQLAPAQRIAVPKLKEERDAAAAAKLAAMGPEEAERRKAFGERMKAARAAKRANEEATA